MIDTIRIDEGLTPITGILDKYKFTGNTGKKTKTNPIYLKAEEISKVTGLPIKRLLRIVKNDPNLADRALQAVKEGKNIINKSGYYITLIRRMK